MKSLIKSTKGAVAVLCLLALAACGGGTTTTAPTGSTATFAGTYNLIDNTDGTTASATFDSAGNVTSCSVGTVVVCSGNLTVNSTTGNASFTINGNDGQNPVDTTATLTGTIAANGSVSGSYTGNSVIDGPFSGTFTGSKAGGTTGGTTDGTTVSCTFGTGTLAMCTSFSGLVADVASYNSACTSNGGIAGTGCSTVGSAGHCDYTLPNFPGVTISDYYYDSIWASVAQTSCTDSTANGGLGGTWVP